MFNTQQKQEFTILKFVAIFIKMFRNNIHTPVSFIANICSETSQNLAEPLTGMRILDIGCGAGLLSEPLARLGAEVTAIDAVEENIECARQHASKDPLGFVPGRIALLYW